MTLNEAKNYLGTGAEVLRPDNKTRLKVMGIIDDPARKDNFLYQFMERGDITYGDPERSKLLCRPLSDLVLPCLEEGKIPKIELELKFNPFLFDLVDDNGKTKLCVFYNGDNDVVIDELNEISEWLYSHHFWLGDQSRFGQDILDINSINS